MNIENDNLNTNSPQESPTLNLNPNLNPNPNPNPNPADDPDPQQISRLQSEAGSVPQPLRARRVEIKARAGSFLHKLTHEQRDQLFLWLAEHSVPKVAELVAQPPPAGFGLAVQHTTLRRIRSVMTTLRADEAYKNAAHDADSLSETIDANRVDFAPVIGDLLLQKTFDLTRNAGSSPADLKEIIASFVKLRELELKNRRLQLNSSPDRSVTSPKRHQVDLNIIPPFHPSRPNPPNLPAPAVQLEVLQGTESVVVHSEPNPQPSNTSLHSRIDPECRSG